MLEAADPESLIEVDEVKRVLGATKTIALQVKGGKSRDFPVGLTFGPFASLKYVGLKFAPGRHSSDVFSFFATYVSSFFPADADPVRSPSTLLLPDTDA